jgi:glyceraldehyde-3-phosphate dehydrogenase/erythrose-4-phosphate dehydrogenase
MIRVAVNGYGRIGRSVLRAVYESKLQGQIKIVAINEPADNKTIAHLTRYDSTHGRFLGEVNCDENTLTVCGDSIAIVHVDNLDQLPWSDLNVDVVLECSGRIRC